MNVSNNSHDDFGDIKWPPGFRFHPNDDELVLYYLKRKICRRRIRNNVIGELDVYKWDPEELPGQSILKTGDRLWFFFSHRDRRYPSGGRVNRATRHGYWKATGKDRNVTANNRTVGVKKTLVFYRGRAPTGERTDWVMHEYILAEEELRRCPTPQDPYVLYKVYKKSGPGPKNGEQYGATFREEEWADDDDPVDVQPITAIPSANICIDPNQGQLPVSDTVDIFGQIVDDLIVNQQQLIEFAHDLYKVGGEEETPSTMVDTSLGGAISIEPRIVLHPGGQHSFAQASFEVAPSATSNMYSGDVSEVTSAPTISEQDPYAAVVGGNFLEINDLLDPEPSVPETGNTSENLQLQEMIRWDEADDYFDVVMFLNDLGNDTLRGDMASQFNYQLSSHTDDANNVSSELWTHEQRSSIFASSESDQVVVATPTSGFVYAGSSANSLVEARQNQGNQGEQVQDSWISSKLWGILESIPTTPASASENALINRALDRMSSFSRVRINTSSMDAAAKGEGGTSIVSRTDGSVFSGFLSFLGKIRAAVLLVLMFSVAVSVFPTLFGRFIPS